MEKQNDHKNFQRKYGAVCRNYCNPAIILFAGIKKNVSLRKGDKIYIQHIIRSGSMETACFKG